MNRQLRAWVAIWLQERRRARVSVGGIAPPAPLIVSGWYAWNDTEFGWVDNYITIEFDAEAVPEAQFEIWERDSNNSSHLLDTIGSASLTDYRHVMASEDGDTFYYKVRYRNGGIIGPFSNEMEVEVQPL
jgi:hypothetical protein